MAASDKTPDRYEKLAAMLREARTMLIVMQDHPDPDAIGAAMGLRAVAHKSTRSSVPSSMAAP
ncbi:MAG: hypothetical protein ACLFV7_06410 [Phycisphaerae bacterium]